MLARFPRPVLLLLLLVLLVNAGIALATAAGAFQHAASPSAAPLAGLYQPPPIRVAKKGGYTDVHLYEDIVAEMDKGKPYHQAAAEMQRAHRYPLTPFITMRLPTLAEIAHHIGWKGARWLEVGLAFLAIFFWVVGTESQLHWSERVLLAAFIGMGAGNTVAVGQPLLPLHEYWGGLLIALGLAGVIGWPRKWGWVLLPIACGLAIRELVLPFALLALGFAAWDRRWREVAGWAALILAFAGYMAIHAQLEQAQIKPGDFASAGWHEAQGFSAFLKAVVGTSGLGAFPRPIALFFAWVPILGWLTLDGRKGAFCLALIAGYVVMIAAFSRADTFYWGAIMLPWYFAGYALLPRAAWQIWSALREPEPLKN